MDIIGTRLDICDAVPRESRQTHGRACFFAWVMGGSLSGGLSHLRSLFTGHITTPLHCSQIFLRYLLLSCYAWYPWLQTDESGAIELKTGGVRHVYQLLYTDSYGNCRPRRKKQRRSWKNYILIWSSRISDAPALKCIVNRWAESVVMVKPVPVFYLAKKTSISVVWELLSENFIVVIEVIITRGTFGPPWTPPRADV